MKYWIVESLPGRTFTTFRHPATGEAERATIGATRIGPFASVAACADHLGTHALLHASYTIEREREAAE